MCVRRLSGLLTLCLAALVAVGCHADQETPGWSLSDGAPTAGQLQQLGEVPTGNPWSVTCDPSPFIGEVDHKFLVRRYLPSAEILAVDPATGDWETFEGVPHKWGDETFYAARYERAAGAEWVWGFPDIALYRPDSASEWREASIGLVKVEEVGGVLLALGAADQATACHPELQNLSLYRHEGGDRWSALREDVTEISVVGDRLFITVPTERKYRLLVSDDAGATWTPSSNEFTPMPYNVIAHAGGFAMNAEYKVWLSQDGLDWQPIELPEDIHGVSSLIATPFGPLVWSPHPYGDPSAKLFQLVDGRLALFPHQPPEAGDLTVSDGRLAVLGRWKGLQIFDPTTETWNSVRLALGQVDCLAQDEDAFYAGTHHNINRLERSGEDAWQPLPLIGEVDCAIPTDAGLMARIKDHPDAPPDGQMPYHLSRYDAGQWQLLEPIVDWPYIRRDGVRFDCDDEGVISRYGIDGATDQIATLSDTPSCAVLSVNQERMVLRRDQGLALLGLHDGEIIDASEGLLRWETGEMLQIRDVHDTDKGLFLVIHSQIDIGIEEDPLLRWDPDAKRWEQMTLPGQREGWETRAFAGSQTTLYAATPGGIWRLDGADNSGDWTRLVDLSSEVFAPKWLDAWNDELLISTDYFQVYRYMPPGE